MFDEPGVIDLPWNQVKIPEYKKESYGKWKIHSNNPPYIRGYYNGMQEPGKNTVLSYDGNVWMSTTPMEIESMMPYIDAAHGTVVIGGAGLGIYMTNVLHKPEVDKVTLIEKNADVLKILDKNNLLDNEKLEIIPKDIFNVVINSNIDFMFIDIWMLQGESSALGETKKIWKNIPAKSAAFWTQEIEFIYWCRTQGYPKEILADDIVKLWVESTEIPLYTMDNFHFWAIRAAQNMLLQ